MSEHSPKWEVYGGDIGFNITQYFYEVGEVLEFCGKMLYGQTLFQLTFLRISTMEKDLPDSLGDTYSLKEEGARPEWILKRLGTKDEIICRTLGATHELFAMLVAEMRLGARMVEVRHHTNAIDKAN